MEQTKTPLFPDTIYPHRDQCWNCGERGLKIAGTGLYRCACGCGWTNRPLADARIDRDHYDSREYLTARRIRMPLVDFTKPGALSSPA